MPCIATPRGFTDVQYPWNDATDNNPCGKKALTSVGGVNVTAEALCIFHWEIKHGQADVKAPIVIEP